MLSLCAALPEFIYLTAKFSPIRRVPVLLTKVTPDAVI